MADDNDEVPIVSTDEAILSSIGEGDEPTTSESTTSESTGTEADPNAAASTTSSEQGTNTGSGDNKEGENKAAGPQDLVDANGTVIAAGGKERRFYETANKERLRADNATKEVTTLKGQLEAINSAGTVGTQYNLSPEEVTTGAQLIAAYKENPLGAIKHMLTQAQANGYNIDELTGTGIDMSAVKQMLDNAIAPLVGDRQERIDTQQATEQATVIYNEFITKFPDATVHEDSLSRLLKDTPELSLEAAYYKLQNYYLSKNLDWTKSLSTLQTEIDAAKPATANVNTQPQPPEGGGVASTDVTDTAQVADVGTSTSDIIRQAMGEAGIS